ncbi:MAG: HAD-IIIA family hydrolase [Lachnospiraceae bacterium]|nr:HAD-IIIA family hydrolase [Lachnospiraceae bacterium]
MPEESYFEIDEPSDFLIAEDLLRDRIYAEEDKKAREGSGTEILKGSFGLNKAGDEDLKGTVTEAKRDDNEKPSKPPATLSDFVLCEYPESSVPKIRMFLTDCDGCLTDGGMYYSENGDELKRFNTYDGMGLKLLKERGIITGIVTAEDRRLNKRRAEKLKLDILVNSATDKLDAVKRLSEKYEIPLENIAYVGDDINDIEAVQAVGFGCSVQNGAEQVKKAAKYVSEKRGGEGAIREIADYILSKTDKEST